MEASVPQLKWAVINCHDAERLAEFWSAFLDVRVTDRSGNFVWLARQNDNGISIGFQEVPDPTPGRNRVHFDASVPDLNAAAARVKELGGVEVEHHDNDGAPLKVMADPEGNEFCIMAL